MFKSIRAKLFISFLLTTILVVLGMSWFMRWSLDRGFSRFIENRQKEHVANLVDSLSDYYAQHQGWQSLAGNRQQWITLLWQHGPHSSHRTPPWLKHEPGNEPASAWPPPPPPDVGNRRIRPLEFSVMLLDADKSIIFGRPELAGQLKLQPITYQNRAVGYLGVLPGKSVTQLIELEFIEQQSQAFVWIAAAAVLLSAAFAWLLALVLGRPVKRITAAAQALAVGHYEVRLPVESKDELGLLARDFNDMASALEQAEHTRKRWVADISHELRTPLAVLRAELEALQDGIRPLAQDSVDSLLADVMRLYRLTEDLYQLSLSDQGALSYRKMPVDPARILSDDWQTLQPEFDKKQIRTEISNALQEPAILHADPDRLSQLFRNLLRNSLNYTDAGGQLQITLYRQANCLSIDFNDSAPGVTGRELPLLFDRFYRVEASRSRNHGGAGLGLAICRNIVLAHHGTISAQPSALGGLMIHLEFPLAV
ncbi:MAG: two-component sensor histidine kinase [Methylobacter sp.]|nr:MAG: two-component sensor histidine kinase [Methylobacter sp.]PPD03583.1 MAG: two-component sensor histidine kinase [Methylobacter sp.]